MRQDMIVATTDSVSRASNVELTYDASTRSWIPATINSDTGHLTPREVNTNSPNSGSTTQVDSQTEAEKEYIEIEFNTLEGELVLTPSEKSIRIKVNDTIKIEGLGEYLSGLYFVSAVKRTLSKDNGYSHSFTLIKNGFGDSLKKSQEVAETRVEEVPKTAPTLNKGDSVKIVGDDAVYSNGSDGVKVPAWVKKKTHTIGQVSNDGTRVLLKEIVSWTYSKYIQKL